MPAQLNIGLPGGFCGEGRSAERSISGVRQSSNTYLPRIGPVLHSLLRNPTSAEDRTPVCMLTPAIVEPGSFPTYATKSGPDTCPERRDIVCNVPLPAAGTRADPAPGETGRRLPP